MGLKPTAPILMTGLLPPDSVSRRVRRACVSTTSTAKRMVIHVRQAKGRKDRDVMPLAPGSWTSPSAPYWKGDPAPRRHWLFPGQVLDRPVNRRDGLSRACIMAPPSRRKAWASMSLSTPCAHKLLPTHLPGGRHEPPKPFSSSWDIAASGTTGGSITHVSATVLLKGTQKPIRTAWGASAGRTPQP